MNKPLGNIPALRANIGNWTYYVTTLTFEQVANSVSKIDNELHKSKGLRDSIQRSITENYISIKDYILNQEELFFNSLVLAVYDDYPNWREIDFAYQGEDSFQMGLLEFPGTHKIFPVDGQHRVEGIKAALKVNPELGYQRITAIFIGHKNDPEGMQRTRRLFTTLNRYAKPVKLDDIIALDEDDTVAITTRYLLEEFDLFTDNRIVYTKQKAIPSNNKDAITSIITLYQANIAILKYFYEEQFGVKLTPKKLNEYLKFRKPQEELDAFQNYCIEYWTAFKTEIKTISEYLSEQESPAAQFRNDVTGGNLIFRPIGFLPLVQASLIIKKRSQPNKAFADIFRIFDNVNLNLDSKPWHFVAWNPRDKKMIMRSDSLIQLLLIYLFDETLLEGGELKKLKEGYAAKIAYENKNIDNVLDGIK